MKRDKKKENMKAPLRDREGRMRKPEIHKIGFFEDIIERMRER